MTGAVKKFGAGMPRSGVTQPRKPRKPNGYRVTPPTLNVELEDDIDPNAAKRYSPKSFTPSASQRIMVAGLSAFGIRNDGIATYIRINEQTLQRCFREELETGFDKTEAALAAVLLVKALGGNMSAISLLVKCKMGWRENSKGDTDGPATIEALSTEQRLGLIKALRESIPADEAGSSPPRKNKARLGPATWTTDLCDTE